MNNRDHDALYDALRWSNESIVRKRPTTSLSRQESRLTSSDSFFRGRLSCNRRETMKETMRDISKFDRLTLRHGKYGGIDVMGWGTHGRGSVLEGQPMKCFLDNFNTEEEARTKYPTVQGFSNAWTEPKVNLSHLPGEDDPVAGGMYQDDTP